MSLLDNHWSLNYNWLFNNLRSFHNNFSLDIFWGLDIDWNLFVNIDWLLNNHMFFSINHNWVRFFNIFRYLNISIDWFVNKDLLNHWLDNLTSPWNWNFLDSLDNLNFWLSVDWSLNILRNLFNNDFRFSGHSLDVRDLEEILDRNWLWLDNNILVGHTNRLNCPFKEWLWEWTVNWNLSETRSRWGWWWWRWCNKWHEISFKMCSGSWLVNDIFVDHNWNWNIILMS